LTSTGLLMEGLSHHSVIKFLHDTQKALPKWERRMFVVTGATGRTGRVTAETLLAKGEKVRVVGRDVKRLATSVELGADGCATV
jgi:hypothetical protein